jgi:hypothetical protein
LRAPTGSPRCQAADDEAQRARKILLVDVAGDMALVKVELDYPR